MGLSHRCLLLILLNITCLHYPSYGRIVLVPGNYPTIQAAMDAALPFDTVLISEGRYFENLDFKGKALTLGSLFIMDGNSAHIRQTIIDGSHFSDSLRRSTIILESGEDTTSVVKGLRICGGSGTQLFVDQAEHWCGGGILINNSGGLIEHNLIENNHLTYPFRVNSGAGLLATAGEGNCIVIRNNLIQSNSIETTVEVDAGGMMAGVSKGGYILIENNRILNNRVCSNGSSTAHGGGVSIFGMYPEGATLIFRNNLVAYNTAIAYPGGNNLKAWGGGVNVIYYDYIPEHRVGIPFLRITDNNILHNFSSERGGGIAFHGGNGGINMDSPVCPQVYVSGNRIIGNKAAFGAGIHNLNTFILLKDNMLDNDISLKGSQEVFNDDLSYGFLNYGIVNAYQNNIHGGLTEGKNIFTDYPFVRTLRHTWRLRPVNGDEITMNLIPPSWRSWWALSIYALLFILFLWLYRRYLFYRFNLRAALKMEKAETERIRKLDQVRSRFFVNISHEFRTPLTLISGPLQDALKEEGLPDRLHASLQMMQRNVDRMMRLIRQLLELARLEAGATKLHVTPGNLSEMVLGILSSYHSLAEQKNLEFNYTISEFPEPVWHDRDKVEKILNNLLSNAFNFSRNGDCIEVSLNYRVQEPGDGNCTVELVVSDTGPGMDEKQLKNLFNRFFRAEASRLSDRDGSGIGLSMVRELVDLYRGNIRVDSKPGEGSRFVLEIPGGKAQFSEDEMAEGPIGENMAGEAELHVPVGRKSEVGDLPLVLLAEDNDELRKYMVGQLENEMRLLEASNGRIALDKALTHKPDLIISDLVMPEMDGAELVESLRNDERSCHIPLIMLTARADLESKLDCFDKGSDDFIEKPFSMDELRARVHQLIEQRKSLREHYLRTYLQSPDHFKAASPRDDFLGKLESCIRHKLSDPDLNVEELSRQMCMSRVQLYRKVNTLTGISPVELIRNMRLAAAARLFREGYQNVTQVMLEVGFSTPSYFTESFRKLHGCNPSEYIKTHDPMYQ